MNSSAEPIKVYEKIKIIVVFILFVFSFKPALAAIDNVSPNAGELECQPIIKMPLSQARQYALTGKLSSSTTPDHSRAWYASALGEVPVLDKLIKNNPDLIRDKKLLALAAGLNNGDVLAEFLSHGANPNMVTDRYGSTLLQTATICQHAVNMMYLLNAGADVYKKNKYGASAMSYTLNGGVHHITFTLGVMILLSAGYNPLCHLSPKNETAYSFFNFELERAKKYDSSENKTNIQETIQATKLKNLVKILKNTEKIRRGIVHGKYDCG